jgi:hypothetical protein
MAFVAIKIGRRPTLQPPAYFLSQPFGPRPVGRFSAPLTPHVSISDMLVVDASPARTALKNSQLTPRPRGGSFAISGTGH